MLCLQWLLVHGSQEPSVKFARADASRKVTGSTTHDGTTTKGDGALAQMLHLVVQALDYYFVKTEVKTIDMLVSG
jgi:hypothetical protein